MSVQRPTSDSAPGRAPNTTRVPNPAPSSAKPRAQRGRRTAAIAVFSVLATAITGATATALITPERVDQLFGAFGGTAPGQVTSESRPVDYKTVTDTDRAVALQVPAEWIVVNSSYDFGVDGIREPGAALLVGDGVGDGSDSGESAVYLAASTATASRYQLPESTPAERTAILRAVADEADWSLDNCLHATDELTLPPGFAGVSTNWNGCAQTDGMRVWEIYAGSDDGAVFLFVQIFLPPGVDAAVAQHLVETLTVTRSEIPGANP